MILKNLKKVLFLLVVYISAKFVNFFYRLENHKVELPKVQCLLGMETSTPYRDGEEIFIIESVEEYGLAKRIGLKKNDEIITNLTVIDFYHFLFKNQGKSIRFVLKRNLGEGEDVIVDFIMPTC